jgi:hypothetical protein
VSPEVAARLDKLEIHSLAASNAYHLFVREECVAVAHRGPQGEFTSIGSSGLMTGDGLAYLIWRHGQPFLIAHGDKETSATPDQVEAIRRFAADLKQALGLK